MSGSSWSATIATLTNLLLEFVPVSSSRTVRVTVYGPASVNTCLGVREPASVDGWNVMTVPSPKSQETWWVSSEPTSVNVPAKLTVCPRTAGAGDGPTIGPTTGATLFTGAVVAAVPDPVSSSVTVTSTPKMSDGVPVGLSSKYWWLALNESTPAARFSVVEPSPVPQLITTVCVSRVPGSANDPDSVDVPFSSIVPELSTTFDGATLFTVTVEAPVPEPVSSSVTVAETWK